MAPPGVCPVCGKPTSTQRRVKPFCCVAHRSKYTREQKRLDNVRFMATRAQIGDLVENDGVVCCVKNITTEEVSLERFKRNTSWTSTFTTWCGREVEIPKALGCAVLTCIACISEGADVRCSP